MCAAVLELADLIVEDQCNRKSPEMRQIFARAELRGVIAPDQRRAPCAGPVTERGRGRALESKDSVVGKCSNF